MVQKRIAINVIIHGKTYFYLFYWSLNGKCSGNRADIAIIVKKIVRDLKFINIYKIFVINFEVNFIKIKLLNFIKYFIYYH